MTIGLFIESNFRDVTAASVIGQSVSNVTQGHVCGPYSMLYTRRSCFNALLVDSVFALHEAFRMQENTQNSINNFSMDPDF